MDVEPEPAASSSAAAAAASAAFAAAEAASAASAAAQAAIQAMMVQITTDGVPKLHCPVCNKALVSLNGYVKHVKKHEPPGGFHCRYCSSRYCSEDELKRHRDEVHTTIACRMCKGTPEPITFTNEIDYREHIRAVHDGIDREMFKCDKCGAEYKTIDPYKRHMDTQCGTIKPHKCDQCPMAFVTKYNLKQHKEVHSGERKFCCSYCGKNFLQKGRLVEHERSHTGEKPYKCDVCGKCFAHRESIVTHSSIHTGIRLVECKCCLSRFSCYSNLIKHRRTRPETCGLAEYDPPKNRVRTHRSRIPPTLNPTSEIKVSSMNKIIKPIDQEHFKKTTIKKEIAAGGEKPLKPTARKRTGPGPRGGQLKVAATTKRKKKPETESESESETEIEMSSDESDNQFGDEDEYMDEVTSSTTKRKRKTRHSVASLATTVHNGDASSDVPAAASSSNSTATTDTAVDVVAPKEERKPIWSDDNSEESEDYPDFDPADDSESEEDRKDFKLPLPIPATATIKQDPDAYEQDGSSFEYSDALVDAEFKLKSEDEHNIFNEKDKLLDCLLNTNNDDEDGMFSGSSQSSPMKLPSFQSVKMEENCMDESEMTLIKDENDLSLSEEDDVLDVKDISDSELTKCKILLEDVTVRYPKLKDEASIKVSRNVVPFFRLTKQRQRLMKRGDNPPRKYRKRGEPKPTDPNGPKRMAKISQQELKARIKMLKKEEKSWPCPHCIKIYHMRKPYEKHLRDDHKRPEEEIRQVFKMDEVGVINEEIFKCQVCDKIYLVEKRLIAHVKLHGPDGTLTFKCPCFCNLYFTSKEAATAHAQEAHRKLLFCEICQKFMTGHDSLKNHNRNHHPPANEDQQDKEPRGAKRNLVCDKCGKKFSGRTSLTDHVRSECGKRPLYACSICGKHLTTAGILKTHMLLHKDDTPYQCDVCGKTFKVKAQYKTHIKTRHTDYKPFQCHLCPKAYPYRESLLTHMTVHTGIKRFLCNGCGKRFTCISNLQAHRKVHADTCGALPLNAKATQYMGVQKGNLLLGAKPEAGLEYQETNTLIAREVLDRDMPMAQEINTPPPYLATVPLNYSQSPPPSTMHHTPPQTAPLPMTMPVVAPPPHLLLPQMMISRFIDESTHSQHSTHSTHSSHSYN